jgi:4-amino-4-deoxy-L-arabinose transferase-like glycosyltransferase
VKFLLKINFSNFFLPSDTAAKLPWSAAREGNRLSDFLILALLFGGLFGFQLGARALWSPIEGRYAEIPREMAVSGDYVTPRLNGVKYFEKPPLFYWLQAASIKLFGIEEAALRLWPAILALGGCLAVYLAGRELFGRMAGLIAAVVLGSSPLYFALARLVALDMALTVFLTCALLSFLIAMRQGAGMGRRAWMWGLYIFAALAVLTKGLVGIVIPALVIGAWGLMTGALRSMRPLYFPSGLVWFASIVLPWHVLVSIANPEFFEFYFIHEHFERYLGRDRDAAGRLWTFVPVLLLGFFPWSAFLFQALKDNSFASRAKRGGDRDAMFLALWAAMVFLFFSVSSSQGIPYILPMFPPLALLVGRYFAGQWDAREWKGMRSGFAVVFIAVGLVLTAGAELPQHYLERYSNWPSLGIPDDEATVASSDLSWYPDLAQFGWTAPALVAIGIAWLAVALLLMKRRAGRQLFASTAIASALALVVLDSSLPALDQRRSVKQLAEVLRPRLQPADEVIAYHAYYPDLPVYLNRRIAVTGWEGEFKFGAQVEDVSDRLINEEAFRRRWTGAGTVYMITSREIYEELRARPGKHFYPVAQTEYNVLLSNRAISAGSSKTALDYNPFKSFQED